MEKEYNLSELVADVSQATDNHKKTVEAILKSSIQKMAENVGRENRIEIKGLGVLKLKFRAVRRGTLQTQNGPVQWEKPSHYSIVFRPDPEFIKIADEANLSEYEITL